MKHIILKIISLLKRIFFFFRVMVTLEIGKSDEKDAPKEGGQEND